MPSFVPPVRFRVKQRLLRWLRRGTAAGLKTRLVILINLRNGREPPPTAAVLHVHRDPVYRVARRFREPAAVGLRDRRQDNGPAQLDERFLATLDEVVRSNPQDQGGRRPTWTRALLVATRYRKTGVRVHVATRSRAFARIRARRGRPRPPSTCPWAPGAKTRRLNRLRRLVEGLPRRDGAVYEDEVDIHLNPKIGCDGMGCGQQKEVATPGPNEQRYRAAALDVRTGRLLWVEGTKQNAWRFVTLLAKRYHPYPKARVIPVILDNDRIHTGVQAAWALAQAEGRMELHFLPPYSPEANQLERVGEDLPANVTRNPTCPDLATLMREVRPYLQKRDRRGLQDNVNEAA